MRTWVDASTIIALDAIGETGLLRELLGRISITPEVAEEVFTGRESAALREARGAWIKVVRVRGDIRPWSALGLGRGEASLFLTQAADRLVLDEVPARTVAEAEGRKYTGLLGLLLGGVDAGAITVHRAREVLGRLVRSSFRMTTELYDEILRALQGHP